MSCQVPTEFDAFKLRVNIKASISKVYEFLATPAGLESWFLRKAIFKTEDGTVRAADSFIQSKDKYSMFWFGYTDEVVENGLVLKANGIDLFSFSFSKNCPVEISIFTEQGETIVELKESDLPTDEETSLKYFVGDSRGWVFYLTNLKSVLEGGLDLRNKNVLIKDVITS